MSRSESLSGSAITGRNCWKNPRKMSKLKGNVTKSVITFENLNVSETLLVSGATEKPENAVVLPSTEKSFDLVPRNPSEVSLVVFGCSEITAAPRPVAVAVVGPGEVVVVVGFLILSK